MQRIFWLVLALLLSACGGGSGGGASVSSFSQPAGEDLSDISAYVSNTNYAQVLADCVRVESVTESCSLDDLPLLGQEHSSPSIDQIMARLVVSHDWMGERFRAYLQQLSPETFSHVSQLLTSVTAIVIDDDIRPSYYTTLTAAIYLDPAELWLTNAEKDTINRQQDYRADFDNLLNVRTLWRYVIANNYAYSYYSLNGSAERSLSEIILPFSELLFHELAHAKDFIPLDIALTTSTAIKPAQLASSHRASRSSTQLQSLSPLNDSVLFDLADVMYRGEAASISLQLLSADEVGDLFEVEGANDHYAYSTAAEDFAMLFEEAMMKYHFDADRDVAFSVAPADETNCQDYLIGWGVRHRLGDVNVKTRAAWTVSELLPTGSFSLFFQDFPLPIAMVQGVNWCDNLLLSPLSGRGAAAEAVSSSAAAPTVEDIKVVIDPDQWLRPH